MHRSTPRLAILALGAGLAMAATPSSAAPDAAGAATAAGPRNGRIFFTTTLMLPPLDANAPGGQIWSVSPDGSGLRQLTHQPDRAFAGAPSVSPDGRTVAYVSTRGSGDLALWLMDANGQHQRRVLSTPHTNYYTPAWSPDGSTLMLTSCDTDLGEQDCPLVTVKTDGTGLTTLLSNRRVNTGATYSPDGTQVQFSSDQQGLRGAIWLMHSDGSAPTQVTDAALEGGFGAWAPNGRHLTFTDNCCQPHSNVYSIRPDGTRLTQLTHVPFGEDAISQDYSPDGGSIVYADVVGTGEAESTLVVADAEGRRPHAIVDSEPQTAFQPSWAVVPGTSSTGPAASVPAYETQPTTVSTPGAPGGSASPRPDGRIAYTDADRQVVVTINPDGSAPLDVTTADEGAAAQPAWTPDGTRLVVEVFADDFSSSALYEVGADGSDYHLVLGVPAGVYDYDPQVTPDGKWIVFARFDQNRDHGAIWAVRMDGTHAHHVTPYTGKRSDEGTYFHAISPDGTKLAYQVRDREGVADQIWVGDLDPNARLSGGAPITAVADEAIPYSYSADGQYVLGSNFNDHLGDGVFAFPDAGGTPRQLGQLPYPHELFDPLQSPSGAKLAYIQEAGELFGDYAMVVANPDGSDPEVIPTGNDHPTDPQWGTAPLLSASAAARLAPATPAPRLSAAALARLRATLPDAVVDSRQP